ncbi:MAG: hypothetical protein AAFW69_05090, partial [Pseudomonadota bacterium]
MFRAATIPRATYVMTDFDRLAPWEHELAVALHDAVRAAGCRVLNDPRRALPRPLLLRRLHAAGLNSFRIWEPARDERPDAFPCFLRTAAAHRGSLTDLLETTEAADAALAEALAAGHPLADLMFVEYRAEPLREGHFQKRAAHVIGDAVVPALTVNAGDWQAKLGAMGFAKDEDYVRERAEVDAFPHAEAIRAAFRVAGLDYGRADFGVVEGRVEVYEINTNPTVAFIKTHPSPDRIAADARIGALLDAAFAAVDTEGTGLPIPLDTPRLLSARR